MGSSRFISYCFSLFHPFLRRYVRVKRNHQTIFLHVEPNETVQSVKAQVGEILGQSVENIRLYGSDRVRPWIACSQRMHSCLNTVGEYDECESVGHGNFHCWK